MTPTRDHPGLDVARTLMALGCDLQVDDYLISQHAYVIQISAPMPGLFGDRTFQMSTAPRGTPGVTEKSFIAGQVRYKIARPARQDTPAEPAATHLLDELTAVTRQLRNRGLRLHVTGKDRQRAAAAAMQKAARSLSQAEVTPSAIPEAIDLLGHAFRQCHWDDPFALELAESATWLEKHQSELGDDVQGRTR